MKRAVHTHTRRRNLTLLKALLAIVLLAAAAVGIVLGYSQLRELYEEQFTVTDVSEQVTVNTGKLIRPDTVIEAMNISNGCNLARIDFDQRRQQLLAKYPAIREITIRRFLPGKAEITVIEREPAVRLGLTRDRRKGANTGRVADAEGVVFKCFRGTTTLPLIREAGETGTPVGKRLEGRERAALELALTANEPNYLELNLQSVDLSHADWLVAVLGDYSQVKIAWLGMDEGGKQAHRALLVQLDHLVMARRQVSGAFTWNATDLTGKGDIQVDTKEIIP